MKMYIILGERHAHCERAFFQFCEIVLLNFRRYGKVNYENNR